MRNMLQTVWDRRKAKSYGIGFIVSSFIFVLLLTCFFQKSANAAETGISVKEINYLESTITLQVNSGDTKVYFSDSSKKVWEEIPGTINSANQITMDISWVSASKNYVMNFKGNSSTKITSVTIPKQVTNFTATFKKSKGTITFKNAGTRTIEWRKSGSTTWNIVNTDTISKEVSYLYNHGAMVYFRLAPVNGTDASNVGFRASKEASLTIPKRTNAPSVSIDGSTFSIAVKKGMAYRTVDSDGVTSDWNSVTTNTSLLLKNIASKALYTGAAQEEVTLQFRTNATSSSQVSNIATLTVPVQEGPPSESTYGISLTYTSSSTLDLKVKSASNTVPFEYTIVEKDEALDYQTAKWKTINSGTAVNINADTAKAGSHIFVRKKSVAASSTVSFSLASKEIDISGPTGVAYPDGVKAPAVTTLVSVAGVCRSDKTSSYLTFYLNSPTSATVSSISFRDAYGIDKGTVTCKSTVAKNANSVSSSDKYIITTKITSTENLDKVTEEMLYADITLSNSDKITSTSTSGILLYLYPNTVVKNPTNDDDYTSSFERVYLSQESGDKGSFKFKLDFGTSMVADTSGVNKFTSLATAIQSIKYDGYTLAAGTDYIVEYGSYMDEENKTVSTATVTVNVKNFEASTLIDTTDKVLPLVITLNNNEVLDNCVSMKLISTATMNDIPIAWSLTEGSLKETVTSVKTNTDGTTTKVEEEVISFSLTLTIFDKNYEVGISDVTWGGTSIFGSAIITNGTATIYLSNAKINKLTTNSTDTNNIVITLSNGFVIKKGCKLTILNAS